MSNRCVAHKLRMMEQKISSLLLFYSSFLNPRLRSRLYRGQTTAVVFIMSWRPELHGHSSCLCLSDVSSYSVQMPRAGNCQHEDQKKNLSSIIKQACRYQDSNKSRIGTRISAILHLMIRSFSKVLGNAKLTVLTQALVGAASMGVISAFLLFDVSRPHSTIKEKQIGSEYQIKLIVQPCPYQDPNESRIGTKFKP